MDRGISEAIDYALSRGFQVHPSALQVIESIGVEKLRAAIKEVVAAKSRGSQRTIGLGDLEDALGMERPTDIEAHSSVIFDPTALITPAAGIEGYRSLFASRFSKLKAILSERPEGKKIRQISSVKDGLAPQAHAYFCGLVVEKKSERGRTKVVIDDPSGQIEIAVFDGPAKEGASMLLNDQMVMVHASASKSGKMAIRELISPDAAIHEPGRSENEAHAAFVSDLHVGSKYFMEKEFAEFVAWLGSDDLVASKIRFLVIGGDLVDGVGIYKNQDKELLQQTVQDQLQKAYEMLSKVPERVQIIISPGNHDPGRRALPQPAIPRKYCPALWERGNITMVGNPAVVSLNGVRVMVFHGQSIDDMVKTTPGLEYAQPSAVMRQLMRARHLSPIFGANTPIAPEAEDLMVIEDVPDILHTGHVHTTGIEAYRGTLMVNSGAWQKQTPFQASVGITPATGLATVVNLKTLKPSIYQRPSG